MFILLNILINIYAKLDQRCKQMTILSCQYEYNAFQMKHGSDRVVWKKATGHCIY